MILDDGPGGLMLSIVIGMGYYTVYSQYSTLVLTQPYINHLFIFIMQGP